MWSHAQYVLKTNTFSYGTETLKIKFPKKKKMFMIFFSFPKPIIFVIQKEV